MLNDGVSNQGPVRYYYAKRERPGTYFRSGSSAGGWGGGAALGVKLARPGDDVVHVAGDGYLMFVRQPPVRCGRQHATGRRT